MTLPRAFTFTTDAKFRKYPYAKLQKGETTNGDGWLLEIAWLKLKIDIFNIHAWNKFCATYNHN